MQKFYVQKSLTRGAVGLTTVEQGVARTNLNSALGPVMLELMSEPVNGTAGVPQTEKTTVVGTVVGTGVVAIVLSSVDYSRTFLAPATNGQTAQQFANAAVAYINGLVDDNDDFDGYVFGGEDPGAKLVWEKEAGAANDVSMNINIGGPGTTVTGITSDAVSDNSIPGVAPILGTVGEPGQLADNGFRTWVRINGTLNTWREVLRDAEFNSFGLVEGDNDGRKLALYNEDQNALQGLTLTGLATNEIIEIDAA